MAVLACNPGIRDAQASPATEEGVPVSPRHMRSLLRKRKVRDTCVDIYSFFHPLLDLSGEDERSRLRFTVHNYCALVRSD